MITTASIRRYYDQNTRLFHTFATAPRAYSIHRAVWAPEVHSADEALEFTNGLLYNEIAVYAERSAAPLRLVDLGCGIGGALFYLLTRLAPDTRGIGLTISTRQAQLAQRQAQRLGLAHRCLFVEGDFQHAPLSQGADAVFSVEAFLHAVDAAGYLAEAVRLLKPGGRLILCDDFLVAKEQTLTAEERTWVTAYRSGWHAANLEPAADVVTLAQAAGLQFLDNRDLTPHLWLHTLPPALARWVLRLAEQLPARHAIVPSMVGSLALQHCLQLGLVRYQWLVFEKPLQATTAAQ